ncbi:choline kinase [Alkalispirochaeta odontotermitis]|nr:choline kinase [Alkalispirochaeta odontotermitis]CAB1082492.1 Choline kinase (EC [Olavius algarvensis Delta 1 endosymbiont]
MNKDARDKVASLDFWSSAVEPEPLEGGITNTNFIVNDRGRRYVVRVGDDIPLHGVMRFNEIAAAHAAHAAGLSPEIVHQADGVFVMRFIEGRTLSEEDVRQPTNLERIVPLIRACHTEIPQYLKGPMLVFWPFHVCRSYILTAREGNSRMMDSLAHFAAMNAELEKAIGKIKVVFGHNDLLAANFMDDGQRLWLLDWDYAGFNTGLFDLAGLSSNNELAPDQEDWVLEAYYQRPVTDSQRRRLAAMKCVSLLRETLWSIVSEIHSTLAFDYENYTQKNLTRLEQAYEAFQQMD